MLNDKPSWNDVAGTLLAAIALIALAWLAIGDKNELAIGALTGIAAGAAGWLYRGRLERTTPTVPPEDRP